MSKEALKLALEALESCDQVYGSEGSYQYFSQAKVDKAITAIKQALAAPVQEPVAIGWDTKTDTPIMGYTTPPAAQPAPVHGPDWKAEYLKSVESGCITLDELRETLAELEATNRQVEILSDALAESRREVTWGVDWGRAGDKTCVSIIKRLPNGKIEVVAVEYQP